MIEFSDEWMIRDTDWNVFKFSARVFILNKNTTFVIKVTYDKMNILHLLTSIHKNESGIFKKSKN